MTEHTPGPWRIGRPSVMNGVQILKDYDMPARSDVVCSMPERGKGRTANARLIASAPDLLAALQTWQTWHANHFADFNEEMNMELLCIDNDAAAAIAKATT